MRLLLVLALVHGLCPAFGEVVEAAIHYAVEGHLPHTDADHGDLGDQGSEHGCGTTWHQCGCCASQAVAAAPLALHEEPLLATAVPAPVQARLASLHEPAPPFRPPIAS